MKALLAILITVFCFALLLGLLSIRSREDRVMTERLNYFAGGEQAQRQKQKLTPKALLYNCIEGIANGLGRLQQGKRIELMMQQADWPIRGTEFEAILLLWGGLVGLITFLVTLKGAMFFAGLLAGILLGMALLGLRIRRRRKKFTNQLGDMLTMVANALRAGFSFMQAFEPRLRTRRHRRAHPETSRRRPRQHPRYDQRDDCRARQDAQRGHDINGTREAVGVSNCYFTYYFGFCHECNKPVLFTAFDRNGYRTFIYYWRYYF